VSGSRAQLAVTSGSGFELGGVVTVFSRGIVPAFSRAKLRPSLVLRTRFSAEGRFSESTSRTSFIRALRDFYIFPQKHPRYGFLRQSYCRPTVNPLFIKLSDNTDLYIFIGTDRESHRGSDMSCFTHQIMIPTCQTLPALP
jgi:hypothetical protein